MNPFTLRDYLGFKWEYSKDAKSKEPYFERGAQSFENRQSFEKIRGPAYFCKTITYIHEVTENWTKAFPKGRKAISKVSKKKISTAIARHTLSQRNVAGQDDLAQVSRPARERDRRLCRLRDRRRAHQKHIAHAAGRERERHTHTHRLRRIFRKETGN